MQTSVNDAPQSLNNAPQADRHQVMEYRMYPLAEAILIGLAVALAIFSTTYFIYLHALSAQKGEIIEGLVRTGSTLAAFIDGDVHRGFVSREQEATDAYVKALMPFQKVLEADKSIIYVYTNVLKDDKVYFILDPTPPGEGEDDKSHIMDPYEEAPPELFQALREQKLVVTEEPYVDRWGTFVSGFIPIYGSQGEFSGVLGIDIDAANYAARLAPVKRATLRAMVAGFFIAFLVGAVVWFMRNFSLVINRSRLGIYSQYFMLTGAVKTESQVREKDCDVESPSR